MQSRTALTRWFFIILSIFIISLILWNTYAFFNELKENERTKMEIWASAQQEFSQTDLESGVDLNSLVLEVIQKNTTTPMILYSEGDESYDIRNIEMDGVKDSLAFYKKMVRKYAKENNPIEISYTEENSSEQVKVSTLYYGNSELLNKLKYYPAALILIIILFFSAIYFFWRTSKSSEQNKLWAGMAKETAHQIGTPLSSLVGWTEILKAENVKEDYIAEMGKDISRLQTITERFSKVGSVPKLERYDVISETQNDIEYLKNRSSKLIDFEVIAPSEPVYAELNPQLYGWTIENLVKNGIDAMKGKGKITVTFETNARHIFVRVSDTGKGIPKGQFKRVFNPGFTTKKRGWGLGLSLAKRIIEEYHKGRIRVVKSSSEGTTMEIGLRRS